MVGIAILQGGGLSAGSADDAAGFNGWGGWVFRLSFVACAAVGRVIVSRAPGNSIGPLFLATGLLGLVGDFAYQYADQGLYRSGDPLPGSHAAAVTQNVSAAVIGTLGLALLLFPDGRLPSRGLRWAAAIPIVGMTSVMLGYALMPGPIEFFEEADNPWGVAALEVPAVVLVLLGWVLMPLGVVVGGIVTVKRFRRSTGLARQQLKWVALAGVAAGALLLANLASWFIDDTALANLRNALIGLGLAVFPVAVGIAILRYQLYDVDVVINRTLVYSGLTASLAATYLVVVLLLQAALRPLTEAPTWRSRDRPCSSRRSSGRPAHASRPRSTVASTAAATTPRARWRPSPAAARPGRSRDAVAQLLTVDVRDRAPRAREPLAPGEVIRPWTAS